jgi:hypothetical protein
MADSPVPSVRTERGRIDMHIALAPFKPKPGVTEETLLKASDDFETDFVQTQDGILKRILVKAADGSGYLDVVFFTDLAAIDRVVEAEQTSEVCAAFFSIMEEDGEHRVYEVLKTYD